MERVLTGISLPVNWVSVVGALEGLLMAAGKRPLSPSPDLPEATYLMGVTGHAFHAAMDVMATPEGPSQFNFHQLFPLWERTRAWFHRVAGYPAHGDLDGARAEAWRRIVRSIDRGWPAIAYDLGGRAEYGLITGYREVEGRRQLRGLQHGVGEVEWFDLTELPPAGHPWSRLEVITLVAVEPGMDHEAAEEASVRFAVDHAWWAPSRDQWLHWGLRAYDVWIGHAQMPGHPPAARSAYAYCAQVFLHAREAAAAYLAGLSRRRSGPLAAELAAAAAGYAAVAAALRELSAIVPWPEGADLGDAGVRQAVVAALRQARKAEEGALGHLERALRYWR